MLQRNLAIAEEEEDGEQIIIIIRIIHNLVAYIAQDHENDQMRITIIRKERTVKLPLDKIAMCKNNCRDINKTKQQQQQQQQIQTKSE